MKPDHQGALRFAEFVTVGDVKEGSTFLQVSGELDVRVYHHILSTLTLGWMLEEKKLKLKVVAGPIVMVEDKKMAISVQSEPIFLGVLMGWLMPIIKSGWIRIGNGTNQLIIEGFEVTIKSLEAVLSGDFLFGNEGKVWPGCVDKKEEFKWIEKIIGGPNAHLYKKLEKTAFKKFNIGQWMWGVWPLFAGYRGSYNFCMEKTIQRFTGKLIKKEKTIEKMEAERIKELVAGDFTLPKNKKDLIKNCGVVAKLAQLHRNKTCGWVGKEVSVGPLFLWPEILYQLQTKALKEVKEILRGLDI